jgi:phosphomannomutase/phosphoglucomutase
LIQQKRQNGGRIKFPYGWALIRASNTQPSLVIRFEADSEEHLKEIEEIFQPALKKIKDKIEKQL